MDWLFKLYQTNPTAQALIVIALVCVVGMAIGSIKARGIGLGVSGVLFAGIIAGHFSQPIDHATLEFIKEFGLTLFVFCIGLQLGPGFFSSLRQGGLRLNLLSVAVVLLGVLCVLLSGWLFGLDNAAVPGLYAGATTNTPSLGAAQQALLALPGISGERASLPAMAYAVAYPVGVVGIIGSLLALKALFRVNPEEEARTYLSGQEQSFEALIRRTLVVANPNMEGIAIEGVPGLRETGVVVSRIRRAGEQSVAAATGETQLHVGDSILVVGTIQGLVQFERVIGRASEEDLFDIGGTVTSRRVILTNKKLLGRTIRGLDLAPLHGVTVTRVARGDVEMVAIPNLRLRFGDALQLVGPGPGIEAAARSLGNSVRALDETHFLPLFAGIAMGVALGTMPIAWPGLPQPLRIGLAGGALIVALLVGRLGRIGRLVWHMPRNANLAFREFGIALFFAGVGLMAGPNFFVTVASRTGVKWLICGTLVTVIPVMIVGLFARAVLSINFVILAGLLAGSMTDPPALSFAGSVCRSEAPAVSYATVYPLTMLLRIASAQVLTIVLCS